MRPVGVGMLGLGLIGELQPHRLRCVPDEAHARGRGAIMAGVVESLRAGRLSRGTFVDGFVVNAVLVAARRPSRSGTQEPVLLDAGLLETTP